MRSAAKDQSAKWGHVAVIPTPCERYMAIRGNDIIGGVYVEPANSRAVSRYPGMRSIGAYKPRSPRRRIGSKISADISGREINRSKTGDLKVSEILAHAASFLEDLFGRGSNVGHFRIEAKILVDA